MKCPDCDNTDLRHLHDAAHGIPETHMVGSERYECKCGKTIHCAEGTALGFKFILDGDQKGQSDE